MSHTPGPWEYIESASVVLAEDGQMSVADIRGYGMLSTRLGDLQAVNIMDANGRLIALSPDMYSQLQDAYQLFVRLGENGGLSVIDTAAALSEAIRIHSLLSKLNA